MTFLRCSLSFLLVLLVARPPAALAAADDCPARCPTLRCALDAARCLLQQGRSKEARDRLKALRGEHPDSAPLQLLLARAYWAEGNVPWTRRVLGQAAEVWPASCEVRAWQIWLHLQQAELDQAQELLRQQGCPDGGPVQARWQLLEATLARYRDQSTQAARAIALAQDSSQIFAEDRALLAELQRWADPGRRAPVRLRLDLGGGYTTNGLMSSPADVAAASQDTGSPVLSIDARLELEPPWGRHLRPVAELGLRSLVLTAGEVSDYTYASFLARAGVLAFDRLKLLYAGQLFLLAGGDLYGDGPRMFYETHRAELELEATGWLSLWAGLGRALFREQVRTRTELDGGGAVHGGLGRLRLLGGLSLRAHWTETGIYDLVGGMVLGSATYPVGPITARGRALVSFDSYPNSSGYFASEARNDWLLKGVLEAWSPDWRGLRLGLTYELAKRLSTIDDYAYVDHRPLLRLSWSLDFDPGAPRTAVSTTEHVELPYGIMGEQRLEDERIQDILRQEDAARRGSSCVN